MPDVEITIGDRKFFVSCREGEEHFLNAAAKMLDSEATPLQAQMGRLPEARMLLMAGLMLADRTASVEDELRQAKIRIADLQAAVSAAQEASPVSAPVSAPEATPAWAAIPPDVAETLAQLAARAEALADMVEQKAG